MFAPQDESDFFMFAPHELSLFFILAPQEESLFFMFAPQELSETFIKVTPCWPACCALKGLAVATPATNAADRAVEAMTTVDPSVKTEIGLI